MSMQQLLTSIADTIKDYRQGDMIPRGPDHVKQWINQFDEPVREPILTEINHVLKNTYLSKAIVKQFLNHFLENKHITKNNPTSFWKSCIFLSKENQLNEVRGNSQNDFLEMFDELLKSKFGYGINDCGKQGNVTQYIYLDDISFTGGHLKDDLGCWIRNYAPNSAELYIILVAYHTNAQFVVNEFIKEVNTETGKDIRQKWYGVGIENRKDTAQSRYYNTDVLRPMRIPPSVRNYTDSLEKPDDFLITRTHKNLGGFDFFSSFENRDLLEQEFLKIGVEIRDMCGNLNTAARPLGYMTYKKLGFGSLLVTFRNCPNNCPLAFWVDKPWYPLFPRKTN